MFMLFVFIFLNFPRSSVHSCRTTLLMKIGI